MIDPKCKICSGTGWMLPKDGYSRRCRVCYRDGPVRDESQKSDEPVFDLLTIAAISDSSDCSSSFNGDYTSGDSDYSGGGGDSSGGGASGGFDD